MSNLLTLAASQIGIKEITGKLHNKKIVRYAKESGFEWINDDETPWCSIFINWLAKNLNLEMSKKANARSWLNVGKNVDDDPLPGDVVIFFRGEKKGWKGHVGIFMGYDNTSKYVFCLGGNQSNSVSIAKYESSKILGFRRIDEKEVLKLPEPTLEKGSKGIKVKSLQKILNYHNFKCGKIDGMYGPSVEKSIKEVQKRAKLDQTGIYDRSVFDYLTILISE